MPDEVRLWRVVEGEGLHEVKRGKLNLEERLEDWLEGDISMLDPGLLVIGRQVETEISGPIDLLCIDAAGDLVIVELKRHKTPRDVTAQALEYASWVDGLSNERVTEIADAYLKSVGLGEAFRTRFGTELPETLNGEHSIVVVGSVIDEGPHRIPPRRSGRHGVRINAATFQYFQDSEAGELVARVFLIEPSQVDLSSSVIGSSKKRRNLTRGELAERARQAGVTGLYEYAVSRFEALMKCRTTLSSIAFTGKVGGGQKVILSLIPDAQGVDAAKGLRYQLYKNRFAELTGLSEQKVLAVVPAQHDEWAFGGEGGDPDWEGFQGVIADRHEVDRLAGAIERY